MSEEKNQTGYKNGLYVCQMNERWESHEKKVDSAMGKVIDIHTNVMDMKRDTEYLNQLPVIAQALQDLKSDALKELKKEISGKGGKFFNVLICAMFGGMLILVIVLLKDSNKNFNLNKSGVSLTNGDK